MRPTRLTRSHSSGRVPPSRGRARRALRGLAALLGTAALATPAAAGHSSDTGRSFLFATVLGTALVVVTFMLGTYFLQKRRSREPRYRPGEAGEDAEDADLVRAEAEDSDAPTMLEAPEDDGPFRRLDHDEYDPVGTALLLFGYFLVLSTMWGFMYFVEFVGNGPTVVG